MGKPIESDFVYEKDGIVKFLPLGKSTGFYYGSTSSRKLRGFQTFDLKVAESILYCAELMVKHLKSLKKTKTAKKKVSKKKVAKKKGAKNA